MKTKRSIRNVLSAIILAAIANYSYSQPDSVKLENLSLKELLSVKVTTASRTAQELGLTPASVMLISKEQIKMRGYQSFSKIFER